MPGVARRIVLNAPVRLVSITARHCSSVMRTTRPSRAMPALFTRIVTRPNAASTSPNAASTAAGSATSALHGDAPCRPRPRRRAGVSSRAVVVGCRNRTRRDDRRGERDRDRAADAPRPAGHERDAFGLAVRRSSTCPIGSSALAHVMPAPTPEQQHEVAVAARGRRRPLRTARAGSTPTTCCRSARCSTIVRSGAKPSRFAAASMMRRFAWCGTNHATSATVTPARSSVAVLESTIGAHRPPEHLLALHLHVVPARRRPSRPTSGVAAAAGRDLDAAPAAEPSQPRSHASSPARRSSGASTAAPAPSPNRIDGAAVVGIHDAAERLRADDQHVLVAGVAASTRRRRARRRSPRTRRSGRTNRSAVRAPRR